MIIVISLKISNFQPLGINSYNTESNYGQLEAGVQVCEMKFARAPLPW